MELVDYRDGATTLQAAVAYPAAGRGPAVLVAHAWAGRGNGEHRVAKRLADVDYVGVAIDIFGKGVAGDPSGDTRG